MKNAASWRPTKVVPGPPGQWVPGTDYINPGSHHIAALQCATYAAVIGRYATGRLLDLGCGTAPYYGIYRDQVSDVVTVDWGESPHDLSYVDITADVNQPLPLPDAQFDTVLAADLFEHVARPFTLFPEVGRVLAPGGTLIAFVPFMYGLHETPYDYFRYTRYALESLSELAGLEVRALNPYGGGPDVILDIAMKATRELPVAPGVLRAVSRTAVRSRLYQRVVKRSMEYFPIGYALVARRPA